MLHARPTVPRRRLASILVAVLALALVPLAATAQDVEDVREERETVQDRLSETNRRIEDVEGRIFARRAELEKLDAQTAELTQRLRRAQSSLQTRARSAYKHGGVSTLQALVSGEGPTDAIERASVLDALARRDDASVESATALRVQLEQTKQLRAAALADLERLQDEIEATAGDLGEELQRLKVLERDLELRAKRQRMVDRGMQQGIYSCPMQSPYNFIDSWGFARSGGRSHKGVDIMAPYRNEIYAFTSGRITRMKSGGLGGIVLYLQGDDGNRYYYAHLAGYADSAYVGKHVDAGALIAYNGDSGNAKGGAPHLHFEVHPGGGSPVNPYPWTAAACY